MKDGFKFDLQQFADDSVEENITDLINDYLPKEPQEEDEPAEESTENLTPKQMEIARAKIFQDYQKAQMKNSVNESKKVVGSVKEELQSVKEYNQKLENEIKEMKQMMSGLQQGIKKIDDQSITKEFLEEEEKIANHQMYGSLYDKAAIREAVIKKAQKEGRYQAPIEELKIQKFDEIYKRMVEAERALGKRKEYMGMNQGTSTLQNALKNDGLSDVKDIRAGKDWAIKKFNEEFGLN